MVHSTVMAYKYLKVTRQTGEIKKFKMLWGEHSEWGRKSALMTAKGNHRLDVPQSHA